MKQLVKLSVSVLTVFFTAGYLVAAETDSVAVSDALKKLKLSGKISLETSYEKKDFADASADDTESTGFAGTVELGIDVDVDKNAKGHVGLKWEEDGEESDSLNIDEAFILLGGNENIPFFLKAGKMYAPFGKFETKMVSDPLTLEIGETRETAAEIGFNYAGLSGSVYAFNGEINLAGEDDKTDNFGANLGFAYESGGFSIDIGCGYINNIYDSNGLTDQMTAIMEEAEEADQSAALKDYVPGMAAYLVMKAGGFFLYGEYISMLDDPETEYTDTATGIVNTVEVTSMKAWNVEAGYSFDLSGMETTFAAAYQGVKNAEEEYPENRYMGVIGVGIMKNTTVAVEYVYDKYENDDKGHTVTGKVEIEF